MTHVLTVSQLAQAPACLRACAAGALTERRPAAAQEFMPDRPVPERIAQIFDELERADEEEQ